MKVYIASFFDTRERLLPVKRRLEEAGFTVVSSWLTEKSTATYANVMEEYRLACAIRDLQEVGECAIFIVDTFDETPRGGREAEFGAALVKGKFVIVVGPMRNVFHRLANKHFEKWSAALDWLAKVRVG